MVGVRESMGYVSTLGSRGLLDNGELEDGRLHKENKHKT